MEIDIYKLIAFIIYCEHLHHSLGCKNDTDCSKNGNCVDGYCQCYYGYTGGICSTSNACGWSYSCLNGGTCRNGICACKKGPLNQVIFKGSYCEISLCPYNPDCDNGGIYSNQTVNKLCLCYQPESYIQCMSSNLPKNACINGGNCVSSGCICTSGFTGDRCEIGIGCNSNSNNSKCLNGGSCDVKTGNCMCDTSYDGIRCEKFRGCTLTSLNCMNGGQCKLIENVYSCQCTSQYSGVQCEKYLGCKPSCQNSGICTSIGDSYYCQCLSQYTGNSCQTFLGCNAGENYSCKNNGKCNQTGYCECPNGYKGTMCEDNSQFKLAVGLGIAIPLLIIFGLAAAAVLFLLYKRYQAKTNKNNKTREQVAETYFVDIQEVLKTHEKRKFQYSANTNNLYETGPDEININENTTNENQANDHIYNHLTRNPN